MAKEFGTGSRTSDRRSTGTQYSDAGGQSAPAKRLFVAHRPSHGGPSTNCTGVSSRPGVFARPPTGCAANPAVRRGPRCGQWSKGAMRFDWLSHAGAVVVVWALPMGVPTAAAPVRARMINSDTDRKEWVEVVLLPSGTAAGDLHAARLLLKEQR